MNQIHKDCQMIDYWYKGKGAVITVEECLDIKRDLGLSKRTWIKVCKNCGQRLTRKNIHLKHRGWCVDCYGS